MLVDRKATPWIIVASLLFIVATASYIPYASTDPKGPTGGSFWGLTFGIVGTSFMAFAMLLALKKRLRTVPGLGRAFQWMQGHVWLSLLSYPLILYHAGFDWGQPWNLTWIMMWVFTIVIVSGVIGLIIQNIVPKKMLHEVHGETIYDQIDHVIRQLGAEAQAIASNLSGEEEAPEDDPSGGTLVAVQAPAATVLATARRRLAEFYETHVRPYVQSPRGRGVMLSNAVRSATVFEDLRRSLPPALRNELGALESIVEERRQLERQRTLHHWLHFWLLIHVPLSYGLTVLTVVHILGALRFR